MNLKNKCTIITGAASGIGLGIARHAYESGMQVIMSDVNEVALLAASKTISQDSESSGKIDTFVADVSNANDVFTLRDYAHEKYGEVALLVNCAGVLINKFLWEHDSSDWEFIHDINVGGVCNTISAFVPEMIKSKSEAWIVNIGSIASFFPSPMLGSYTSSKFALLSITETLKYELDSIGAPIGVSFVAPGPVKTAIMRPADQNIRAKDSDAGKLVRDQMGDAIEEYGMDSAEVAQRVFDAIRKGDFWVFTHPEMMQALSERTTNTLGLVNPVYKVDF